MSRRFVRPLVVVTLVLLVAHCGSERDDLSVQPVPTAPEQSDVDQADSDAVDGDSHTGDAAAGSADRPDDPMVSDPADDGIVVDSLSTLTSPDVGAACADGLSAADLTAFFGAPVGSLQGADYQRATRLPDDRVLWTFQDAFLDGALAHNAGLIQSGRCFTLLNRDQHSWLFPERTIDQRRWYWPLAGAPTNDGTRIVLFVVEMHEGGPTFLSHPIPTRLHRVELDATTLDVPSTHDESATLPDLYGWSITDDGAHTYLYSHCFQQFGYDGLLGFGPCAEYVKVARVPVGEFDATREYWDGSTWTQDHQLAAPVVDGTFVMSGNNPAQFQFDRGRFLLIEKRDDWWGTTVEFGVSLRATGPFERFVSIPEPLACDRSTCDTYFASWIPWRDADGSHIWSISCNLWDGSETCRRLDLYGPRFGTISIPPP